MKTKRKKQTPLQKARARVRELEGLLEDRDQKIQYWRGACEEAKVSRDAVLKQFEGLPIEPLNQIRDENYFLRETLRLVVVPKGREEELAKVIERERQNRY